MKNIHIICDMLAYPVRFRQRWSYEDVLQWKEELQLRMRL